MRTYFVYIPQCSDNSYYVGITNNIERRIYEHCEGLIKGYTTKRLPVKLVYTSIFYNIKDAINFEKKIKKWRRQKKEALIDGEWDKIIELSKSYIGIKIILREPRMTY